MADKSSYLRFLPPVLWQAEPAAPAFSLGAALRIFEKLLSGIDDGVSGRARAGHKCQPRTTWLCIGTTIDGVDSDETATDVCMGRAETMRVVAAAAPNALYKHDVVKVSHRFNCSGSHNSPMTNTITPVPYNETAIRTCIYQPHKQRWSKRINQI